MTAVIRRAHPSWKAFAIAASLTAMWFLLIGGMVLVGSLLVAVVRDAPTISRTGFVGLGLLVGPALFIGIAALG